MKKTLQSTTLRTAIVLVAGVLLQGCNTTEGIGKDMSAAGDAVSGAAQDSKSY